MTDLARLLPPSIAGDGKFAALAAAAGLEEEKVRGLIDNVLLFSRIDQLSESLLDHLGWAFHLDGWEFADSKEKKAWLVKNFYNWHRYKGTEHGLEMFLRVLLGRRLLAVSPPHKFYWGKSRTAEEQAAFEAPHPEIRAYPFRAKGSKQSFFWGASCLDAGEHFAATDAMHRAGTKVELHDPASGQVTDLRPMLYQSDMVEKIAQQVVEIRLPGQAAGLFWGRGHWGAAHLVEHGAGQRLYTVRLDRPYQTLVERRAALSIKPGLEPITAYYREVKAPGQAAGTFFANRYPDQFPDRGGRCFWRGFWVDHRANERVYKSIRLFDPARFKAAQRKANFFWGAFRYPGIPAHTAEVAVDLAGASPRRALYFGPGRFWGSSHFAVSDCAARVAQVREVVKLCRRRSGKVELAITNRRAVAASAGILAGTVTAGEYRLEVIR